MLLDARSRASKVFSDVSWQIEGHAMSCVFELVQRFGVLLDNGKKQKLPDLKAMIDAQLSELDAHPGVLRVSNQIVGGRGVFEGMLLTSTAKWELEAAKVDPNYAQRRFTSICFQVIYTPKKLVYSSWCAPASTAFHVVHRYFERAQNDEDFRFDMANAQAIAGLMVRAYDASDDDTVVIPVSQGVVLGHLCQIVKPKIKDPSQMVFGVRVVGNRKVELDRKMFTDPVLPWSVDLRTFLSWDLLRKGQERAVRQRIDWLVKHAGLLGADTSAALGAPFVPDPPELVAAVRELREVVSTHPWDCN